MLDTKVTGCDGLFQAESADLVGARMVQSHSRWSGDGFVDYEANSDAYIEWSLPSCVGGAYIAAFRYALISGYRPLQVLVNGVSQVDSLNLPPTGGWDIWLSAPRHDREWHRRGQN